MSELADSQGPDTSAWASPENYNRFIRGLRLRSLRMASGHFSADALSGSDLPIETEITFGARFEKADDGFVVFHRLELQGSPRDAPGEESVQIIAEYAVAYESEISVDDSLFLPFMHLNLPVQTWPYFREFVQSSLNRLDWPRLTLPVLHSQGASVIDFSGPLFDMDAPGAASQDS